MANNGKNSVTKAQAEAHRRSLQQLLRTEDNRRCADCLARGPTWASVNLGVFVCLNCSGVHRSLGTDLSKVRSTTLDTWLPEQVAFVQRMGNRRANQFWEGRLPRNFKRPAEGDMLGLRYFINDKYRDQRYALQTWDKPPTIDTYLVHPFMQPGSAAGPEAQRAEEEATQRAEDANMKRRTGVTPDVMDRRGRSHSNPSEGESFRRPNAHTPQLGRVIRRANSPSLPPPAEPRTSSATTNELFDLLSLNEPESRPSPSVQDVLIPGSLPANRAPPPSSHRASRSQESFADTASSDGGWAAFVSSTTSKPAAAEEAWDAFQENNMGESVRDPFGAQDTAAAPALQNASFQPKFPSAPSSPTPQKSPTAVGKANHRPQKSAEEIMRMFDQPRQQDNLYGPSNFALSVPEGFQHANLWPPFQLPTGSPTHHDLTFPPQMFGDVGNGFPAGMPPLPNMSSAQGWATLPAASNAGFGSGSGDIGKGVQ